MKIQGIELFSYENQEKPYRMVASFIEMADFVANNSMEKVIIHLDDGTKLIFHETNFSNADNEVEIIKEE